MPFISELGLKPHVVVFVCIGDTCIIPVSGDNFIWIVELLSSLWNVAFAALNSTFTGVLLYVFRISNVKSSADDITLEFFPLFNL